MSTVCCTYDPVQRKRREKTRGKTASQSHLHCLVSTFAVPITFCGREVFAKGSGGSWSGSRRGSQISLLPYASYCSTQASRGLWWCWGRSLHPHCAQIKQSQSQWFNYANMFSLPARWGVGGGRSRAKLGIIWHNKHKIASCATWVASYSYAALPLLSCLPANCFCLPRFLSLCLSDECPSELHHFLSSAQLLALCPLATLHQSRTSWTKNAIQAIFNFRCCSCSRATSLGLKFCTE